MSYIDDTPLTFGKYKGKTPRQIAAEDPWYIVWLGGNVKTVAISRRLLLACREECQSEDIWQELANEGHIQNYGDR